MPFPIAAAIIGGVSLLSALLNKRANKQTNDANLRLAQYQFEANQAEIDKQNQYNTPQMQMTRYMDAGLNPNLIYGSGQASAGNQAQAARYELPQQNIQALQIPEILGSYQDFQMRQAQIESLQANTQNTRARTLTESFNTILRDIQGQTGAIKRDLSKGMAPFQQSIVESEAKKADTGTRIAAQQLANLRQDELLKLLVREQKTNEIGREGLRREGMQLGNEKKQAEILFQRYKNEWMEAGVTTSDNLLIRVFVRMLNETGLMDDIGGAVKKFVQKYARP